MTVPDAFCPNCHQGRSGGRRICRHCGLDFEAPDRRSDTTRWLILSGVANSFRAGNELVRRVFQPAYEAIKQHEDRWEVGMAILAVAFVATGFAGDMLPGNAAAIDAIDWALTLIFVLEFGVRFAGSPRRSVYLKDHLLDLIALIPLARGVRVLRLLRLLRLVRAFTGVHHVFTGVDRLAHHRELGTLVIAWFGTMFLCASAFFLAESDVNSAMREPADAIWWGIATLIGGTTDVRPVTEEGRIISALLLVVGVALFTAITAVLMSFFVRQADGPTGIQDAWSADADLPVNHQVNPSLGSPAARQLRELADLRDERLISPTEYTERRIAVLARFGSAPA